MSESLNVVVDGDAREALRRHAEMVFGAHLMYKAHTGWITGHPAGMPRPRATTVNGQARVYNGLPKGKPPGKWKDVVLATIRVTRGMHMPFGDNACVVDLLFIFQRPQSHFRTGKHAGKLKDNAPFYCTTKPDRDNLDKLMLDAMVTKQLLAKDEQVVDGRIIKTYAPIGCPSGCLILMYKPEIISAHQ